MTSICVFVADRYPVVRIGFRHVLESCPDIRVVGEADNGDEALRLTSQWKPHVLLLDVEMSGLPGIEVIQHLQAAGLFVSVLAIGSTTEMRSASEFLVAGAAGYMVKDEVPEKFIEAVRCIFQGEAGWVSQRILGKALLHGVKRFLYNEPHALLSAREIQVLQLIAQGLDNLHIATALYIAHGTVKNHITNIYGKLGLHSRAEAVAWAWEWGLAEARIRGMRQ